MFGNTVYWETKIQNLVTVPTTETEYVALSEAGREILWLIELLIDLGVQIDDA